MLQRLDAIPLLLIHHPGTVVTERLTLIAIRFGFRNLGDQKLRNIFEIAGGGSGAAATTSTQSENSGLNRTMPWTIRL